MSLHWEHSGFLGVQIVAPKSIMASHGYDA